MIIKKDLYNLLNLSKPFLGPVHNLKTTNVEVTSHCNQKFAFCSTEIDQNTRTKEAIVFDTFKLLGDQLNEKTRVKNCWLWKAT